MFNSIMEEFMKGLSGNDRKKMADMCPCSCLKEMSEEDKKAMQEKMMSFCCNNLEALSIFFQKGGRQPGQTGQSEKV